MSVNWVHRLEFLQYLDDFEDLFNEKSHQKRAFLYEALKKSTRHVVMFEPKVKAESIRNEAYRIAVMATAIESNILASVSESPQCKCIRILTDNLSIRH